MSLSVSGKEDKQMVENMDTLILITRGQYSAVWSNTRIFYTRQINNTLNYLYIVISEEDLARRPIMLSHVWHDHAVLPLMAHLSLLASLCVLQSLILGVLSVVSPLKKKCHFDPHKNNY